VAPGASNPGRGPRRRRWRSFPPLQCSLGSVRVCWVGCVRRRGEPRTASCGPHPLFIALCDGGPPTMNWLGAPDQGAVTSPLRPLGRNGREIELTEMTPNEKVLHESIATFHGPLPAQIVLMPLEKEVGDRATSTHKRPMHTTLMNESWSVGSMKRPRSFSLLYRDRVKHQSNRTFVCNLSVSVRAYRVC
jgi:hypothetical protein